MMKPLHVPHVLACSLFGLAGLSGTPAPGYEMIAIEFGTGDVYEVSPVDATLTLLGTTGIAGFGSLEFAPDGTLYGFTTGFDPEPKLYRIDPLDFSATAVGELNLGFVFDGSLAFAPDGTVYGANGGRESEAQLFTIDVHTGQATIIDTIRLGRDAVLDINAMTWRSDGMLVGLDRGTNALLAIDPADATASPMTTVAPVVGGVGGMAVLRGVGYFTTAGPASFAVGSNELYAFDLFTGEHGWIGSFEEIIEGRGFGGLAAVPEPVSLVLLAAGGLVLIRRRR